VFPIVVCQISQVPDRTDIGDFANDDNNGGSNKRGAAKNEQLPRVAAAAAAAARRRRKDQKETVFLRQLQRLSLGAGEKETLP